MLDDARTLPVLGPVLSALRVVVLTARALLVLPWGIHRYRRTGITPGYAYQAMIWLFCLTSGRSSDMISRAIARRRPKRDFGRRQGVLGDVEGGRGESLVAQLRRDGYVVFPGALPSAAVDRLAAFAQVTPAIVRPTAEEGGIKRLATARRELFDASSPLTVRYDYSPGELLANADVQALLGDPSLLHVAQEYLGSEPLADVLSMWWHTGFHCQPDADAAQLFHFDMDRVKWLKIFIYLTDVTPANGPHYFVRGSHRTGGIPADILRRGYVRVSDEEVAARYAAEDVLEFSAPRGSIILEDTRGLHKGGVVTGAPRLILQLQFSNSLFGTNYAPARLGEILDPGLAAMVDRVPSVYAQYRPQ